MRRVVKAKGVVTSAQIEEAIANQTLEDGSPPTRSHAMAGLVYSVAFDNLTPAEEILENKDLKISIIMELLDKQEIRSARVRDRLRQDLEGDQA